MLIKKHTQAGEKYYVNAFTGNKVQLDRGNPCKKNSDPVIEGAMNPYAGRMWRTKKTKREALLDAYSSAKGKLLELMRTVDNPDFNKKSFVRISKQANFNPYPFLAVRGL